MRPIYPGAEALEASQDRLTEKEFFRKHGIPTAPFMAIDTPEDLKLGLEQFGLPAYLKTRRLGYDGKGQHIIRSMVGIDGLHKELLPGQFILEGSVSFKREVSLLAVRAADQTAFYPLVENLHKDGILWRSIVSNTPDQVLQPQAESIAGKILDALNYIGVLAIEFFVTESGLVANEMAPRVHNSGHWTIEGAETSQFENHVRAVCGLPLGPTTTRQIVRMYNLIGKIPDLRKVLQIPGAHLHLYGKSPRAGRKVGHITVSNPDSGLVSAGSLKLEDLLW
jgi:5-(carboxyamino)imidazole ribonucleotide synthase